MFQAEAGFGRIDKPQYCQPKNIGASAKNKPRFLITTRKAQP